MSDVRREHDPRDPAAEAVDQVVFRWGGNQGRQDTGMTAVAHSCPPQRAAELGRELGPLLWVTGTDEPRPSVVRAIGRDGRVMLVQRWPTTDRSGRPSTVSHVLTGPVEFLGMRLCLSLAHRGWGDRAWAEQASGPQEAVSPRTLHRAATGHFTEMGRRLPEVEQALALVAAEWLRDPGSRVSLLADGTAAPGWPDPDDAALVYYGLFLIFYGWLPAPWTFATYDTVDSHPLRLTSVPRWESGEATGGALARVAAGQPSDEPVHRLARRLVERLLAHGPDGPPRPLLTGLLPDGAELPWDRRLARLDDALADRPRRAGGAAGHPAGGDRPSGGLPAPGRARDADRQPRHAPRRDDHGPGDLHGPDDGPPAAPGLPRHPAGARPPHTDDPRHAAGGGRRAEEGRHAADGGRRADDPRHAAGGGRSPHTDDRQHPGTGRPPHTDDPRHAAGGGRRADDPRPATDPWRDPASAERRPDGPPGRPPGDPGSSELLRERAPEQRRTPGDRRDVEREAPVRRPGELFGPLPELAPPALSAVPPPPRHAPDTAAHAETPDDGSAGPGPGGAPPLRAALRAGGLGGLPALLGSPGEEELLHELRQPDLSMEAVFLLLDELTERLRVRELGPAAHHALCTEVLRSGLYLVPAHRHWSARPADPEHLLARAVELFDQVVVPVARRRQHLEDLLRLAERIGRDPDSPLGDWLRESVLALPPEEAPDLPPAVWQALLRDAFRGRGTPPASAPATASSREAEAEAEAGAEAEAPGRGLPPVPASPPPSALPSGHTPGPGRGPGPGPLAAGREPASSESGFGPAPGGAAHTGGGAPQSAGGPAPPAMTSSERTGRLFATALVAVLLLLVGALLVAMLA